MREKQKIFDAVRDNKAEEVTNLLSKDSTLAEARNENGLSIVLHALYHGRRDLADMLLATNPRLDVFDAAATGRTDRLAEVLDEDGSRLNAFASDGFTPLHLAVFFRHPNATRLLLERGADVNPVSRNDMRVMPLHSAVAGRDTESSRLLVEHGADVNAASHEGFRPLHGAAEHGDVQTVEMLLAAGADPTQRIDAGQTPADMAAAAGHEDLAARLRARAATPAAR